MEDARDIVTLDLKQADLAVRLIEVMTGLETPPDTPPELAMEAIRVRSERLYERAMMLAHVALTYFSEQLHQLNTQTQALHGRDMVFEDVPPEQRH